MYIKCFNASKHRLPFLFFIFSYKITYKLTKAIFSCTSLEFADIDWSA